MKVRNFPGRRAIRKARADARAAGLPQPEAHPTVADIRFRVGGQNRGPDGVANQTKADR
jgi:hypothetical protein